MKVEINLEDQWGYDDASVAEILREAIREEIKLAAKRIAKDAVKKLETEAKKAIELAVKRDWKKVSQVIEQLETGK